MKRSIDERERVVRAIRAALDASPHLRVAQLFVDVFGEDPYYLPDDEFVAALEAFVRDRGTP